MSGRNPKASPVKVNGLAPCLPAIETSCGEPTVQGVPVMKAAGPLKPLAWVAHRKSVQRPGHGHANARVAWHLAPPTSLSTGRRPGARP